MSPPALAAMHQAAAFKLLIRRRHSGSGYAELSRQSPLRRQLHARQKILPLGGGGKCRREPLVQRPRSPPPAVEGILKLHGQPQPKRRLIGLRHWSIIRADATPRKAWRHSHGK